MINSVEDRIEELEKELRATREAIAYIENIERGVPRTPEDMLSPEVRRLCNTKDIDDLRDHRDRLESDLQQMKSKL